MAVELGTFLAQELCQISFSIETPYNTTYYQAEGYEKDLSSPLGINDSDIITQRLLMEKGFSILYILSGEICCEDVL